MPGPKTNEREGTRAVLRNTRTSAFKIREVLDLVRGKPVGVALDILRFSERDAAQLVYKLVASAIANAENNDGLVAEELYVSACYADEARTYKTFRPRARGRAGRIRHRSAHITVIVSRLPEERLVVVKAKADRDEANRRARRVAGSRGEYQGSEDSRAARRRRTGKADEATAEAPAEDVTDEVVEDAPVTEAEDTPPADETDAVAADVVAEAPAEIETDEAPADAESEDTK